MLPLPCPDGGARLDVVKYGYKAAGQVAPVSDNDNNLPSCPSSGFTLAERPIPPLG